ncbi:MAG: GNAT family N-acetyltransferase [Pseudomonadota bacterium]
MKFRELDSGDPVVAGDFYALTSYSRPIADTDRVVVAEDQGQVVSAVRIEQVDDVFVLRGMYTHPSRVRQGIGASLLRAVEHKLAGRDSYCLPFAYLQGFYGEIGFEAIPEVAAPKFLRRRYAAYIEDDLDVIIMFRARGKQD